MPKTDWLISKLTQDYPQFKFCEADYDQWSYSDKTVYFNPQQPDFEVYVLHELAHALLDHSGYVKDIELLAIERDAWQYATTHLAPAYKLEISDELTQQALDTYRDWLHTKSACPTCDQTGLQTDASNYQCLSCSHFWRINSGIKTAVRRYSYS